MSDAAVAADDDHRRRCTRLRLRRKISRREIDSAAKYSQREKEVSRSRKEAAYDTKPDKRLQMGTASGTGQQTSVNKNSIHLDWYLFPTNIATWYA